MADLRAQITNNLERTLIAANNPQILGNISKVLICNNSNTKAVVSMYLDAATHYFIKSVHIPSGVSLLLEDCLSYPANQSLRIINSGTNPDIDVTIK